MSIYTVHVPPPTADRSGPDPERFAFVRDGFSFWAFLLTPLWMLRHRLWLGLLGYLIVASALVVRVCGRRASASGRFTGGAQPLLLSGLVGAAVRDLPPARP